MDQIIFPGLIFEVYPLEAVQLLCYFVKNYKLTKPSPVLCVALRPPGGSISVFNTLSINKAVLLSYAFTLDLSGNILLPLPTFYVIYPPGPLNYKKPSYLFLVRVLCVWDNISKVLYCSYLLL